MNRPSGWWPTVLSQTLVAGGGIGDFALTPDGTILMIAWEKKTAEEALAAGMISEITDPENVLTRAMEIAEAQAKLVETIEQLRALEQWRRRVQHKK